MYVIYLRLWSMMKSTMKNKCTSVVGHLDSHGGMPGRYRWKRPMWHVQGYLRSHWTPPSGNYSLRSAPAAARATGKQTTINKYTYFAGRFNGHDDALVHNCVHCPMARALLEATACRPWANIMSNNIKGTWLCHFFMFFIIKTVEKGRGSMRRPLFSIGV
jgi:hypothetical protein